ATSGSNTKPFTVHVTIDRSAADGSGATGYISKVLDNTASVSPNQGATAEPSPDPTNDTSNTTHTTVTANADLAVTVTDTDSGTTPMVAGVPETIRVAVQNQGPSDAGSYTVSSDAPSGTSFKATGQPSGCSVSTVSTANDHIACSSGHLDYNATDNFDVVLLIPHDYTSPELTRGISFTASLTAHTTDESPNTAGDSGTISPTVVSKGDLSIGKTS